MSMPCADWYARAFFGRACSSVVPSMRAANRARADLARRRVSCVLRMHAGAWIGLPTQGAALGSAVARRLGLSGSCNALRMCNMCMCRCRCSACSCTICILLCWRVILSNCFTRQSLAGVGWHSQPRLRVELAGAIRRRWPVAAASSLCRRWFSSGKMGRAAARVCTLHGSGRDGASGRVLLWLCVGRRLAARSGRHCQSCRPSVVRLDGTEPPAGTDRSIGLLDGLPRTRVGLHSRILYMWRSDSFVQYSSTCTY